MLIISHRGNLHGPDKSLENNPKHIEQIINDYCVEVDLRVENDKLYLGHDECQYPIDREWLYRHRKSLWIHCKDVQALRFCSESKDFHYFWHNTDDYTITSQNIVWAYPGKEKVSKFTVLVMPEGHWSHEEILSFDPYGICTDYPESYKYYKYMNNDAVEANNEIKRLSEGKQREARSPGIWEI